jgi:hypothetical protein
MQWWTVGLRDIEDPTLPRQSDKKCEVSLTHRLRSTP